MQLERTGIVLAPNSRRVVLRNFTPPGDQRKLKIIARIAMLSEAEIDRLLDNVFEEFHGRHQKPREFFLRRYEAVRSYVLTDASMSPKIANS